jgi:septal ring factor EnvC (AmiA/AmiB activator)
LSTLTKVLIILQTVFSLLLCGIVATYVANASDYKDKYTVSVDAKIAAMASKSNMEDDWAAAQVKLAEALQKVEETEPALLAQIVQLTDDLTRTKAEIDTLNKRVTDSMAAINSASATASQQTRLYETAHTQLKATESDKIQLSKEYDETQSVLLEKLAVVASQDKMIRELEEEKSEIQGRLEQYLRQYGMVAAPATAATLVPSKVQLAQPVRAIGLKGLISDLNMENRMAEISLGSTDGVKEGMKFIVTRDNKFICNVVVLDVDAERSVGVLDLIKGTPVTGDRVSTN